LKFVWVNYHLESLEAIAQSEVASYRYRIALPALALRHLGHEVQVVAAKSTLTPKEMEAAFAGADLVIFPKVVAAGDVADFEVGRANMAQLYATLLQYIPAPERSVVFDFNDYYFESPAFKSFYETAGQRARFWSACSAAFARALASRTRLPIFEMPDPYEGPGGAPHAPNLDTEKRSVLARFTKRFSDPQQILVLWFGHPANLQSLADVMAKLEQLGREQPLELHCVTYPQPSIVKLCEEINRARLPGFRAKFTAWSTETTWQALESCDLVLLPAILNEKGLVKSANRLIETLRAGRIAVAHPLPAYLEFKSFAWIGEQLEEGIRSVVRNPAVALQRAREGQRYVLEKFSPRSIAERWIAAAA
jgi:glycosyltransferase involved in cell wall biosynthesis